VRIAYDAGGYFAKSAGSIGSDPHTTAYDPDTGSILSETKDGVTLVYRYDILGRVIYFERTEQGKDPLTWEATYARCRKKLCITDAVYYVTELIDKRYSLITYYDKRGVKMNHPDGSLLKDD
jgi:hypothetical protein